MAIEAGSSDQNANLRELTRAIDARLALVDCLTASDQIPSALALLQSATVLCIRAVLQAHAQVAERGESEQAKDAFGRLALLVERGTLPTPPLEWRRVHGLLTDSPPLAFDELRFEAAVVERERARALVLWLRDQVDTHSGTRVRIGRASRLAGAVALLGAIVLWAIGPRAKNVALHKPVQVSSRRPYCPPRAGEAGLPPSGAVDGSKTGAYDVCTKSEVRPWLTVDLEEVRPLSRAVIYDRGDCCQGSFDLPAVLELSEDGRSFVEVGRRTTAYSNSHPWTVTLGGKRARLVRLRVDSDEPRELVLTEVEIYGPDLRSP
jgi:hypothetical protein